MATHIEEAYSERERKDDGESDEATFAFDTGGGTMHCNQSIQTRGRFPKEAPDFGGAIVKNIQATFK